jgi:iron complex transport system substrate-binding protein
VGITHECDFPSEVIGLPRVTTSLVDRDASSRAIDESVRALSASGAPVFALDAGQLQRLAPTLILTQSLSEVCAVSDGDVRSLASVLEPSPQLLSLGGTTLDGVWDDITAVGSALGRGRDAAELLATVAARLRVVHETLKAARAPRPRVAVIEWLDPLFVAGHWTPELVRRAGGIDVLAEPGRHSVECTAERIRTAGPELLLFAPCGFDAERAARESAALLQTAEWRWARGLAAWAIDGNALTSRPGPRLADAVEVMAAIFAPGLFAAPPARYARNLTACQLT